MFFSFLLLRIPIPRKIGFISNRYKEKQKISKNENAFYYVQSLNPKFDFDDFTKKYNISQNLFLPISKNTYSCLLSHKSAEALSKDENFWVRKIPSKDKIPKSETGYYSTLCPRSCKLPGEVITRTDYYAIIRYTGPIEKLAKTTCARLFSPYLNNIELHARYHRGLTHNFPYSSQYDPKKGFISRSRLNESGYTGFGQCISVIDTGLVKEASYDPKSGCGSLDVVPISVSSAEQRAGRAGRITDGVCYRLYTQSAFQYEMPKSTSPELTRCDFAPTLLLLLSMGITTIVGFDFMDPPDAAHLRAAYEQLYALNAIDCEGNLTELGSLISQLPVSPMSAKTIISSFDFGCVDQVLTICSILESGSPLFYIPKDKNKEAITSIKQFWDPEGDHISLYNVYREWIESEMSADWCRSNYVQSRTLLTAHNIKQQLLDICNVMNLHTDLSDDKFETISHCFSRGFFLNSAQLTTNGYYQTLKSKDEVKIHPSSSMQQYSPQVYVMFYEMTLTKEKYIRTVMKLNPEWLVEASPNLFIHSNGEVIFRN